MKRYLAFALLALLLTVGCSYKSDNNISPTDPGGGVTVVTAAGLAVGLADAIQLTDDSKCWLDFEEVACASVVWVISAQATGEHYRTVPSAPQSRVQANGVPAGDYAIEQTTTAADGATGKNAYPVTVY